MGTGRKSLEEQPRKSLECYTWRIMGDFGEDLVNKKLEIPRDWLSVYD